MCTKRHRLITIKIFCFDFLGERLIFRASVGLISYVVVFCLLNALGRAKDKVINNIFSSMISNILLYI